ASVFGEFQVGNTVGIIGVVGPKRMYYDTIIPQIRYFSHLIEEMLQNQGK
ncbi:heat-inducible transcription repressor HrcA, partial [Candidatus Roizmanbacteria bacterium]|nr:heat-inducible transcription repressor HrcA [Candidatus Roizmanbacteria bacterium]